MLISSTPFEVKEDDIDLKSPVSRIERSTDVVQEDPVETASEDSFPASDAPAWIGVKVA
jgi:hypothetical protein